MKDEIARALVERCPVGLSLHGARGEFLAASDECARIFDRPREALLQGSLVSFVEPRDVDRVRAEWDAAALAGREATLRYRLARPAGPVWVETDLRADPPTADGPVTIACASRVVAERAARPEESMGADVERENLDLARRHRDALVHMLPAMVWYGHVTPDLKHYKTSYFNDYLFTLTGHTREEWMGTPGYWRDLIHPDDRERTLAATDEMLRGERSQAQPYRLRTRDGRYLWVQSSMYIERDAGGVPCTASPST
jgi:PAS domain S-box-containing protein